MTAGQRGDGNTRPPYGCRCGRRWYGLRIAHCSACHETFSAPSTFDLHRVGPVNNRRCDTGVYGASGLPELRLNAAGVWVGAGASSPATEPAPDIPAPPVGTLSDTAAQELSDIATNEEPEMATEPELPEPTTAQLRRYAAQNGFIVGVRGRLPEKVRERWDAEPDDVKQRYLADD